MPDRADRPALSRRAFLQSAARYSAGGLLALPAASGEAALPNGSAATDSGGLTGQVLDAATLLPAPGVRITAMPSDLSATTDANGAYVLPLPAGTYTIEAQRAGYVGTIRLNQVVADSFRPLELDLIPLAATPDQQEALYQRVVRQTASPLVGLDAQQAARLRTAGVGLPSYITVYYDTTSPPYTVNVPLEDYVKGVVPNEVPASWPAAALQAQAVAARSYGVASYLVNGFVYPDTRSQVYDPTYQTTATNAAVDATAGQIMTYNGAVIHAFFYSRCNGITTRNSENAIGYATDAYGNLLYNGQNQLECTAAGWNYVAYCRARACGGHAASTLSNCGYYGHGVGMCQWGAFARGGSGLGYQDILNSYYTGVTIAGPVVAASLQLLGPLLIAEYVVPTLRWLTQPGRTCTSQITQGGMGIAGPASISADGSGQASWTLPYGLGPGSYAWSVADATSGSPSASATLIVAPHLYETYVPTVHR